MTTPHQPDELHDDPHDDPHDDRNDDGELYAKQDEMRAGTPHDARDTDYDEAYIGPDASARPDVILDSARVPTPAEQQSQRPGPPNVPVGDNGKPRYRSAERYQAEPYLTVQTHDQEGARDDHLGHRGTGIGYRRIGSLHRWRNFLRSRISNPRGSGAKRIRHKIQ